MNAEQTQLEAMCERIILEVFPDSLWQDLAPQQQNLAEHAMARVQDREGPDALTVPGLEEIKELVTEHLWSPALTEASMTLPG